MKNDVKERFTAAVKDHRMTVQLDQGVHRCIRFARPDTSIYSFTLTTWPGHLAISGDLSDFVFTRLPDMFEFFRGERINPDYWSEKAVAVSHHGGLRQFSSSRYRSAVFHSFQSAYPPGSEGRLRVWKDVREELLEFEPEHLHGAFDKTMRYRDPVSHECPFLDFWDYSLEEFTFGFLFSCHAIRWGIEQYDLGSAGRAALNEGEK